MKRNFTRILAAFALLVGLTIPMGVWGQSTVTFNAVDDITESTSGTGYVETETTFDFGGFSWIAKGYRTIANESIIIGKGGANYFRTPIVEGTITSVAVTWSGNANYYLALQTTSGTELEAKSNPSEPTTETYTVSGNYNQLQLVGRRASGTSNAAATITNVVVTYTPGSVPQPDTYTVSFDAGEGTFVGNDDFPETSNEVEAGTYSLPNATREGYTMLWSDGEDTYEAGADYEVTEDVDFTAQWTENTTPTPGDNVTYNFTSVQYFWIDNTYETHPTTGTSSNHTNLRTFYYDNDNHDEFTATGTIYFQSSYLMMNSGATLTLPTYEGYKITQISVSNTNSCSTSVQVGILCGNEIAAAAQTWNNQGSEYTYNVAANYQGEALTIKVTNDKNAQITGITVALEEINNNKVATPTFDPTGGIITESTNVTITCDTDGATLFYTTDGSTPTTNSAVYSQAIAVNSTMTLKAIAVKSGMTDSNIGEASFTRKYFVNLTQATGGTISANPTQAEFGQTVTLTATPNVGYTFVSWSIDPSNVTITDDQFTMPSSNVTVSATFTASTTSCTVSFSVNDKVEMTATTFGGSIDLTKFVANVTTEGYTFAGWYTAATGGTKIDDNYTPTGDVTVYAQFGEIVPSDYTLVTSESDLHAGDMVVIAASAYPEAMSTEQKSNNRGEWDIEKSNNNISWTDGTTFTVCEFELGGASSGWSFYDAVNNGYIYAAGTKTSGTNYLRTQPENDSKGLWTISIDGTTHKATIVSVGNDKTPYLKYNTGGMFACYNTNSQSDVVLYTKPASKSAKGNRDDVEATSKVTAIPANVIVTVKTDGIVYLTGNNNGNEANLIVEEGGQLVASNNVKGTMRKSITGYGTATSGNYYLISTPLTSSTDPEDVGQMLSNNYDLYYFNQNPSDSLEWRNYRVGNGFNMYVGTGYLYANSATVDLEFAGTLRESTNGETFQKSIYYQGEQTFAGWNLVGNPFPCNAAVNMAFYKMNSTNEGINVNIMSIGDVIAPMEGVFVMATQGASDEKVTFTATTDAVTTQGSKGIALEVNRDNEMLDRAIVGMSEGSMVNKLRLSDGVTELYIPQGDKDYALVSTNGQGEMPVSFKASRNATYTISANIENVDMNYLHLIDNMTGADVDLLATPNYTFEARTNDYTSRFRLVFSANGIDEQTAETFAFFNGTSWTVSNTGDATLQVVDITGRIISSETINGNATVSLNQPAGIYMLRLVNGNDVKVQKVVVR